MTQPPTLDYAKPTKRTPLRAYGWPCVRFGCFVGGIVYPIVGLLFNASPGMELVPVDWQNGQPLAWVSLATMPSVCLPLLPFLLAGWAAMAFAVFSPHQARETWFTWPGLASGFLMGLTYTAIVSVGLADGNPALVAGEFARQVTIGGIGTCAAFACLAGFDLLPRASSLGLGAVMFLLCAGIVFAIVFSPAPLLAVPILGVPYAAPVSVGAFVAAGLVVWQTEPTSGQSTRWALVAVACGLLIVLNALAWLPTRLLAARAYARLPTQQPEYCFVATAARRSAWSERTNHRQLRTLRAFESLLATRVPTGHKVLRQIYNDTGPCLASGIGSPQVAAVAWLALKPVEWLANLLIAFAQEKPTA